MIPALREEFNRNFTPEKYQRLLRNLDRSLRHAHRVSRLGDALLRPSKPARPDGAVWP